MERVWVDYLPKTTELEWATFCYIINWWLNFSTQQLVFSKYVSIVCLFACFLVTFFRLLFIEKFLIVHGPIAYWMQYADDWSFELVCVCMWWGLQIFLLWKRMLLVFVQETKLISDIVCTNEMNDTIHGHCAHWVSNDTRERFFFQLWWKVWNEIEFIITLLYTLIG